MDSSCWLGARGAARWSTSPALAATVGALAVAAIAAPARRAIQGLIDRHFNRRRYDAVRLIGTELADERAGRDLAALFRLAFVDPSIVVPYPGSRAGQLGHQHRTRTARDGRLGRRGEARSRRSADRLRPRTHDAEVVGAGARIAAAELDNAGLRAELARRLGDVESSRRRLAETQRTERRRIERDLHDGAQQRLLALAMELRSAQLSGNDERMRQALSDGATSAQSRSASSATWPTGCTLPRWLTVAFRRRSTTSRGTRRSTCDLKRTFRVWTRLWSSRPGS